MAVKYSDEIIIELIEEGLTDSQIAKKLGTAQGTLHYRLKKLRINHSALPKPEEEEESSLIDQQFDLQVYDTVRWLGKRWRVILINKKTFEVKELDGGLKATVRECKKADYVEGKLNMERVGFAPVKSYNLYDVEEPNNQKPVISESKVEKQEDKVKKEPNFEKENETVNPVQPEANKPKQKTENCKLGGVMESMNNMAQQIQNTGNDIPKEIQDRFVEAAIKSAREYVSCREHIVNMVAEGKPINLYTVNKYNSIINTFF